MLYHDVILDIHKAEKKAPKSTDVYSKTSYLKGVSFLRIQQAYIEGLTELNSTKISLVDAFV